MERLEDSIRMQQNCKYNSKMLINLINDMMDLAKSERMKFDLNNSFFDLEKLVERSFECLGYLAESK
jgi:signal transduction histidine kinase